MDDKFEGLNQDSLPPISHPSTEQQFPSPNEAQPPQSNSVPPNTPPQSPGKNFLTLKKILIIVFVLITIAALTGAGLYFYLQKRVTNLTFIPDDTQFYLGLSVKNHPQVQQLLALSKKLPGGERMVKYIDRNRSEIFGTRKDPFKEILDLADTEIFLAKISPDEPESGEFALNTLEKLVNIVEFKNPKIARNSFANLENNPDISTIKEAYGSAKIAHFNLKDQKPKDTTRTFDTGPLPYQVTLPLSKSIYATIVDKFIVAAEKESDVKKIIDLATNAKEKKMKNIISDKEHNEIVSHFPREYLLKFYQKQVLDPFTNLIPATSLPQTFLLGQSYDTTERDVVGDNVFTTKRGLTIVAKENGLNFTSYQVTKKSQISQGLQHGFTLQNSLANKLPSVFNSNQPLLYAESRNLKESIQDQIEQLEDVTKNSSDPDQKRTFENSLEGIKDLKKKVGETFGIDTDSDLLSWMTENAAVVVAPGFGGKPPEVLFIFGIKDPQFVEGKLSKIKMRNFLEEQKQTKILQRDYQRRSHLNSIQYSLASYFQDNGRYPADLQGLVPDYLYNLDYYHDPLTKQNYSYKALGDRKSYQLTANLELADPITINDQSPKLDYSYDQAPTNIPKVSPTTDTHQNVNLYSIPVYDYKDTQFAFRYATTQNLAIFSLSASDQSLKEIIDLQNASGSSLAQTLSWQEQFANAPKIVGGIIYIIPENVMGIVEYFLSKEEFYKEYVQEDWIIILRGYLKALKSIGTTTTQEGKTLIVNTFVNISEIDTSEAKKVEEALNRVFDEFGDVGSRRSQARDAAIKNDVGQLATALQAYYTTPGQGKYPASLEDLIKSGDLRTVPISPSGESYDYLRCDNGTEAAVFAKLEETGTYWAWTSVTGRASDISSQTSPQSCQF